MFFIVIQSPWQDKIKTIGDRNIRRYIDIIIGVTYIKHDIICTIINILRVKIETIIECVLRFDDKLISLLIFYQYKIKLKQLWILYKYRI